MMTPEKELLEAAKQALTFLKENPSDEAKPIAQRLQKALSQAEKPTQPTLFQRLLNTQVLKRITSGKKTKSAKSAQSARLSVRELFSQELDQALVKYRSDNCVTRLHQGLEVKLADVEGCATKYWTKVEEDPDDTDAAVLATWLELKLTEMRHQEALKN